MPDPNLDNQMTPDADSGLSVGPLDAAQTPAEGSSAGSADKNSEDASNSQPGPGLAQSLKRAAGQTTKQTAEEASGGAASVDEIAKSLVSPEAKALITPETAEILGRGANALELLKGIQAYAAGEGFDVGALVSGIDLAGSFEGPPGIAVAAALNIIITLYEILAESEKKEEEETKEGDAGVLQSMKVANATFVKALTITRAVQEYATQQHEAQIAGYRDQGDVQQQQAYLDDEFRIAGLRDQYQQNLSTPNLSEEQRNRLTENFNADTQSREDNTAVQMAKTDNNAKMMGLSALQNTAMKQADDIQVNQRNLATLTKRQKDAQDSLKSQNLKIDETGKITNAKGEDELEKRKSEIERIQAQYENAKLGHQIGNTQVEVAASKPDPAELRSIENQLNAAQDSYKELANDAQNSNLHDSIQKAQINLVKTLTAYAATKAKIGPAQEQETLADNRERLARIKLVLDEKQRQIDEANEAKKEEEEKQRKLRSARDNDLEAKRLVLQTQVQRDPDNADLQKQMADLKDQAAQNYEADQSGVQIPEPTLQPRSQDDKNPKLQWILNLIAGLETEKKRNRHDPAAVANLDNQIGQMKGQLDDTIYNRTPTVPTPDQLVHQSAQDMAAAQVLLNHSPAATQTPKETSGAGTQGDAKELNAVAQALEAASHSNAELAANLKGILEKAQGLEKQVADLAQATYTSNAAMGHRISTVEAAIASLKRNHLS